MCHVSVWLAGLEVFSLEGAPERGHGSDAGRISGQDVVDRVSDEHGVFGGTPQSVECNPYGFGIGLVSGGGVAADDRVHVSGEADVGEAAHGERFGLAGDDRELVAARVELETTSTTPS